MLRPTQVPSTQSHFVDGDDVESATEFRVANGMPESYLLFHTGTCLSAVRLADQMFVTLDDKFSETGVFPNLDEWYMGALRPIYAELYGLS
jgi:hypothetical protein